MCPMEQGDRVQVAYLKVLQEHTLLKSAEQYSALLVSDLPSCQAISIIVEQYITIITTVLIY